MTQITTQKLVDTEMGNSVLLDYDNGLVELNGRFMPSKTVEFFEPIFNWIHEYIKTPHAETTLSLKLDYFNTSSSKKILDVMQQLEDYYKKGNKVQVLWHFNAGDVDIVEAGRGYADLVEIPFEFIEID